MKRYGPVLSAKGEASYAPRDGGPLVLYSEADRLRAALTTIMRKGDKCGYKIGQALSDLAREALEQNSE